MIKETSKGEEVKIVEAENDFLFASLDFIRVGAGHTVCEPGANLKNAALLSRIINHVMNRYESHDELHKVFIEYKCEQNSSVTDAGEGKVKADHDQLVL